MAAQRDHIEATIVGLKRAIRRKAEANDDDDGTLPQLDGTQSLKRKADYTRVSGGQYGSPTWKRKINHAGYTRSIISINQPRLDVDGDVIEDYEVEENSDEEQSSDDGNPYNEIKLEQLLAPLTAARELPDHPTESIPYTSPHLTNLQKESAKIMRKENTALAAAKKVLTRFRGDIDWAQCGDVHTEYDALFLNGTNGVHLSNSTVNGQSHDRQGSLAKPKVTTSSQQVGADSEASIPVPNVTNGVATPSLGGSIDNFEQDLGKPQPGDVDMDDAVRNAAMNGVDVRDTAMDVSAGAEQPINSAEMNGNTETGFIGVQNGTNGTTKPGSESKTEPSVSTGEEADEAGSQSMHRMTTRNRARAASRSQSPPESPISLHTVHPFFEFPVEMLPDPDCGLPPAEAEETRGILLAFVAKYEEIARNAEELNSNLLKADRMRHDVFKWCKADAHIGEMSDGEDWYDKEEWSLDEDLVKGRDEEDDEPNTVAKKTRQRRRGDGKD